MRPGETPEAASGCLKSSFDDDDGGGGDVNGGHENFKAEASGLH